MALVEGTEGETVALRPCPRHPTVETAVSCGRCERPLCPRCMIFTPVGVRCADCAQLRRLPQYTITRGVYARVIPGALLLALGIGWVCSLFPLGPFLGGIVVGFLVSEGLRRVSGYKQGREMEIIAGVTVVLAVLAATAFPIVRGLGIGHLGQALHEALAAQVLGLNALGIIIGVYIAVQRLR